mgnify:CR=1 FL=1
MKAVTVADTGVQILDVDIPKPNNSEVLVKVYSCGLNRADLVVATTKSALLSPHE